MSDEVDFASIVVGKVGDQSVGQFAVIDTEAELIGAGISAVVKEAGNVDADASPTIGGHLPLGEWETEGNVDSFTGVLGYAEFLQVFGRHDVAGIDAGAAAHEGCGNPSRPLAVEGADGLWAQNHRFALRQHDTFCERLHPEAFEPVDVGETVALADVENDVAGSHLGKIAGLADEHPLEGKAVANDDFWSVIERRPASACAENREGDIDSGTLGGALGDGDLRFGERADAEVVGGKGMPEKADVESRACHGFEIICVARSIRARMTVKPAIEVAI